MREVSDIRIIEILKRTPLAAFFFCCIGNYYFQVVFFTTPQFRIRSTAPLTRGAKDFGNRALFLPPADGGGGFCEAKDGGRDVRANTLFYKATIGAALCGCLRADNIRPYNSFLKERMFSPYGDIISLHYH